MTGIGWPGCISSIIFLGPARQLVLLLLVEAANMGDADSQYELGCLLRVENKYVQSDQQAFYYIEKAVDQLHPGALNLLGAVYLTGDCIKKDIDSAIWCFYRAAEKGHSGAPVAYGSLLLKGAKVPASLAKPKLKRTTAGKIVESLSDNHLDLARKKFNLLLIMGVIFA